VARGAIAGRFRVIPRFLAAAITASRSYTRKLKSILKDIFRKSNIFIEKLNNLIWKLNKASQLKQKKVFGGVTS